MLFSSGSYVFEFYDPEHVPSLGSECKAVKMELEYIAEKN